MSVSTTIYFLRSFPPFGLFHEMLLWFEFKFKACVLNCNETKWFLILPTTKIVFRVIFPFTTSIDQLNWSWTLSIFILWKRTCFWSERTKWHSFFWNTHFWSEKFEKRSFSRINSSLITSIAELTIRHAWRQELNAFFARLQKSMLLAKYPWLIPLKK